MDVELFLEGQTKWKQDSQHRLIMLYQMFGHATDEGQKEVEQTVCQGHGESLPKLDLEADLSAIQLVGPKTTKEEILSLYLQVYKQQRLPGSPPGEPALTEKVVSSFKDYQGEKIVRAPSVTAGPQSANARPSKSRVLGKGEMSMARSLDPIREAHQKALAAAAALKGEIKMLSCPLLQSQLEARMRSKSRDRKRRHHQVQFTDNPASYHPPPRSPESSKGEATADDLELGEPPGLELRV